MECQKFLVVKSNAECSWNINVNRGDEKKRRKHRKAIRNRTFYPRASSTRCEGSREQHTKHLYLYWLVTVKHGGQQNLPKHHLTVVHHQLVGGLLGQRWVALAQRVLSRQTQTVPMIPKVKSDGVMRSQSSYRRTSRWVVRDHSRIFGLYWFGSTGLQGDTSIAATGRWWIRQIHNCKANAHITRERFLGHRTQTENWRHQEKHSRCNIGEWAEWFEGASFQLMVLLAFCRRLQVLWVL